MCQRQSGPGTTQGVWSMLCTVLPMNAIMYKCVILFAIYNGRMCMLDRCVHPCASVMCVHTVHIGACICLGYTCMCACTCGFETNTQDSQKQMLAYSRVTLSHSAANRVLALSPTTISQRPLGCYGPPSVLVLTDKSPRSIVYHLHKSSGQIFPTR